MKDLLRERLMAMASTKEVTPEQFQKIFTVVSETVEQWRSDVITQLENMVQEWESSMGADDKTFYSLGIRRAIDVVREESAFQQLPVLEKPDTPLE